MKLLNDLAEDFENQFINKRLRPKDKTRMINGKKYRICSRCKEEKAIEEYSKCRLFSGKPGWQGICKECYRDGGK